jgi:hypothetical protein
VKYTYEGDANVDGQINADDYAAIDSGFATHATGYANGDFNYSGGAPNSDDYFTIDRAFADQGAALGGAAIVPQAPSAEETAPIETVAPVGAASAAEPTAPTPSTTSSSISIQSESLKRTKHRHHKRGNDDDRVWQSKAKSDALTRFLRRM